MIEPLWAGSGKIDFFVSIDRLFPWRRSLCGDGRLTVWRWEVGVGGDVVWSVVAGISSISRCSVGDCAFVVCCLPPPAFSVCAVAQGWFLNVWAGNLRLRGRHHQYGVVVWGRVQ